MSKSGRVTLPDVRDCSGRPPGCPGVVGSLSRMSRRLGGPPGCLGEDGRPSRMSGSDRKSIPDVREWSEDTPGCPSVVGRPPWKSGSGREVLPNVRHW